MLYTFSGSTDGSNPNAGLARDDAGNLYGTTQYGANTSASCGSYGCGVVFKIDRWGHEKVLYAFTGGDDGYSPSGIALQCGNIYGTSLGGTLGNGTVFKLDSWGVETVLHAFNGNDGNLVSLALAQC